MEYLIMASLGLIMLGVYALIFREFPHAGYIGKQKKQITVEWAITDDAKAYRRMKVGDQAWSEWKLNPKDPITL